MSVARFAKSNAVPLWLERPKPLRSHSGIASARESPHNHSSRNTAMSVLPTTAFSEVSVSVSATK
jgi:hypothetical protein